MNWFIYIGGGIIFLGVVNGFMSGGQSEKPTNSAEYIGIASRIIAIVMVWVWICWRFIQ